MFLNILENLKSRIVKKQYNCNMLTIILRNDACPIFNLKTKIYFIVYTVPLTIIYLECNEQDKGDPTRQQYRTETVW